MDQGFKDDLDPNGTTGSLTYVRFFYAFHTPMMHQVTEGANSRSLYSVPGVRSLAGSGLAAMTAS
jgi:hypothetical protein